MWRGRMTDWVKGCTVLESEGPKPRGRPKKTWMEVVKRDMKEMGLSREDAEDRVEWREKLKGGTANPGEPGNKSLKPIYICWFIYWFQRSKEGCVCRHPVTFQPPYQRF